MIRETATPQRRGHDAERTREEILSVAREIFAEKGLNGARVDEIAEATHTSKRMIYYYFGSKEGLYQAVLASSYAGIRRVESEAGLEDMEPMEALLHVVRGTIDYQAQNPGFARLVAVENIQRARFLTQIEGIREHNRPIIDVLSALIARGVGQGVFRTGLDPVDLHWLISSFAVFNVANDASFSFLFEQGTKREARHARHRQTAEDAVRRYCAA
ncbi:TetR family transcriptional regulator [Novosphingobium sp. 9]|uniref:TetR family transcriptional regulator n=1 Tax=Novosphingobium sp. 9 TaxID=2025349 RepID=UPI0021B5033A|nr:TetR family transcriptional regulator [Novosphingobium sp. 9]